MVAVGKSARQQVGFFYTVAEVMRRHIAARDKWIGDHLICRMDVNQSLCKDNYNLIIKQIFLCFFYILLGNTSQKTAPDRNKKQARTKVHKLVDHKVVNHVQFFSKEKPFPNLHNGWKRLFS